MGLWLLFSHRRVELIPFRSSNVSRKLFSRARAFGELQDFIQLASQLLAAGNDRMAPGERSIAERLARRVYYPRIPLGTARPLSKVGCIPVSRELLSVPEIGYPWIIERRGGPGEPEIRGEVAEPDRVDLDLFLLMLLENL
jgi:hypothetical protein